LRPRTETPTLPSPAPSGIVNATVKRRAIQPRTLSSQSGSFDRSTSPPDCFAAPKMNEPIGLHSESRSTVGMSTSGKTVALGVLWSSVNSSS
jgi:hypothetical protein